MPSVLVTGGAGYVGSHACKNLAASGYSPVVFDNLERGSKDFVKWGPLEVGDICDKARLIEVMDRYEPAAVLHFAAYAYVGESVLRPTIYYRNNVMGSLCLLEAVLETGISSFVFSSTCAIYGIPLQTPISEVLDPRPVSPYGTSKYVVERMLDDFSKTSSLDFVSLRYFNAAGADPEGEIGERHDPEPHLIPRILMAAAGEIEHLEILGTNYPTDDGTCERDYVHVSDLADAHVRSLGYLLNGGESTMLNLGSGRAYSVMDTIRTASKVTGHRVPYKKSPRRPGDPPVLVADATKAKETLGWQPRLSDLDTIIDTAWRWYQNDKTGAAGRRVAS
jgi:UDP-arabinose 4-epimerase